MLSKMPAIKDQHINSSKIRPSYTKSVWVQVMYEVLVINVFWKT